MSPFIVYIVAILCDYKCEVEKLKKEVANISSLLNDLAEIKDKVAQTGITAIPAFDSTTTKTT